MYSAQDSDLAPFFRFEPKSETLSEIKPPLAVKVMDFTRIPLPGRPRFNLGGVAGLLASTTASGAGAGGRRCGTGGDGPEKVYTKG